MHPSSELLQLLHMILVLVLLNKLPVFIEKDPGLETGVNFTRVSSGFVMREATSLPSWLGQHQTSLT